MSGSVFTGFGFGPIQAGLFVSEAAACGRFERLVIAEVDGTLIEAVRANGGRYCVNIAGKDGVEVRCIEGVELYHPGDVTGRRRLVEALGQSTGICTALPSVAFFETGRPSVASLLAEGLAATGAPATLIYAAENNNHAAEILQAKVSGCQAGPPGRPVQYLNTVIGKMSQVMTDPGEMAARGLEPIAPGLNRAFLVESFNHILVSRCRIEGFEPGIGVFDEKDDLLPFEEAKLYGHNAIHALLAWLGSLRGCRSMVELAGHPDLLALARRAFVDEAGAALIARYRSLGDPLFTPAGFTAYADNLLERMINPYLNDTVERAARDTRRKLGIGDRIFGAMSLCLAQGIEPEVLALGAAAGLACLAVGSAPGDLPDRFRSVDGQLLDSRHLAELMRWLWGSEEGGLVDPLIARVQSGWKQLPCLIRQGG